MQTGMSYGVLNLSLMKRIDDNKRAGFIALLHFSLFTKHPAWSLHYFTIWKEESGHVFMDIEGSGAFGAGTGSGRVGHIFERFECVDTKIRHSDSEHWIMAFKDSLF